MNKPPAHIVKAAFVGVPRAPLTIMLLLLIVAWGIF